VVTRRSLLLGTASLGSLACGHGPAVRTRPPRLTHGVQVGDVQDGHALVWARCDEPARMVIEWSTSPSLRDPVRVTGPVVGPATDRCGAAWLRGLPGGQTITYRVRFEREAARGDSAWVTGRFATPHPRRMRVAWTGDTCGQGFGRNPEWGGLRGYAAIRAAEPSLFLHVGDLIYADNPILPQQTTHDGRVWRNVSDERVDHVAETLADFRGRFAYNLEDAHVQALAAEVPIVAQWDDHEVRNNWWPGQRLGDERYTEQGASVLAGRALRAMREWTPIGGPTIRRVLHCGPLLDVVVVDLRSARTANDGNRGPARPLLGADQARWLVDTLAASRARWKIVACDQPLALVVPDGPDRQDSYANGDGPPLGRELELAAVLAGLTARGVRDVVWLTADVHYAAAHHFDPARAARGDTIEFTPFWEFVAGPIHAGSFGPNALDPTFGPEVRFQSAPPPGAANLAPWDGLQSFGTVDVTPDHLRVGLWGLEGAPRFELDIPASS
jgi:alkaline phosphatase D